MVVVADARLVLVVDIDDDADVDDAEGIGASLGKPHPPLLGIAFPGKLKLPALAGTSTNCETQLQIYASSGPPCDPPRCT
jgi:hypothetical protein